MAEATVDATLSIRQDRNGSRWDRREAHTEGEAGDKQRRAPKFSHAASVAQFLNLNGSSMHADHVLHSASQPFERATHCVFVECKSVLAFKNAGITSLLCGKIEKII